MFTMKYTEFWSNNPQQFLNRENYLYFFPSPQMNTVQKWNSLVRLSLYMSVILFLYSRNWTYWILFFGTAALSYILYRNKKLEIFTNSSQTNPPVLSTPDDTEPVYVSPTKDNPFMNVQLTDYTLNPQREAASKQSTTNMREINSEIDSKFDINLYKDLSDVFDKMNSQRQYYTMPVTTIPNKQKSFADWCYDTMPTCKEQNGVQCHLNNHNPLDPVHSTTKIYV